MSMQGHRRPIEPSAATNVTKRTHPIGEVAPTAPAPIGGARLLFTPRQRQQQRHPGCTFSVVPLVQLGPQPVEAGLELPAQPSPAGTPSRRAISAELSSS
jgi:hypothetical protein